MLSFKVFDGDRPASDWPLRNVYLVGADGNAMRADITFADGIITVDKREVGTSALALQHQVGDLGELTIQTCLLPERDQPYLLGLELARHRLMILYTKLEEWGMFELGEDHPVTRRSEHARERFVEALCIQHDEPARACRLAHECLVAALDGTEELALAHAELLLNKRKETGSLPKSPIGCGVTIEHNDDRLKNGLQANFDYVQLPIPWKMVAPEENDYQWDRMDDWAQWAGKLRLPVIAGPVISFEPSCLPDWLYIWEHDYDTVRDLIYEHIEKVVSRYRNIVTIWNIVSGLHVNNHFTFNFEQLMDLTRMATMLVKKIQPHAQVMVELRQPFGEYYAQNPRSIPPMMYADLIVQSAIAFDAFGLRLPMGQAVQGQYTRDLMQVSSLFDQFAHFGKPLYLTVSTPSEPITPMMIADAQREDPVDAVSGYWRRPWSQIVQSRWAEAVFQIAISKPYVEAIAWQDLIDFPNIELPMSGLLDEEIRIKDVFRKVVGFRKNLRQIEALQPAPGMMPPMGPGEAHGTGI
ncbi:MAG: endo-1,4-beta-xylanase [Phycisphaerales bacterium JB063]